MTFTLPDNPEFPLEVETVTGHRAWIDSDSGPDGYSLIGRIEVRDGSQEPCVWSDDGEDHGPSGNGDDLTPLFVSVFPPFIPPGWTLTKDGNDNIWAFGGQVQKVGLKYWGGDYKFRMTGLEHSDWDWDKTFHPSWDWTKCKLQKPEGV